jgi:Uma2 family endonuclease
MEANRSRSTWTYAEFARLPSDTSTRYEVIDGTLVVTPAPGRLHQRALTDLVTHLNTFVRDHDLGEVFAAPFDVLFDEGDYLEPDIVFLSKARTSLLTDRGAEGPPDLVVEVTSPATAAWDRGIKLERYRHYGVGEYWIVDPGSGTIERWAFGMGGTEPELFSRDDVLRWAPAGKGVVLEVTVEVT